MQCGIEQQKDINIGSRKQCAVRQIYGVDTTESLLTDEMQDIN
jgi:hypothetical protein